MTITPKTPPPLLLENLEKEKPQKERLSRPERMALLEEDPPKRQCSTCRGILLLSQFPPNKAQPEGRSGQCRPCICEAARRSKKKRKREGYIQNHGVRTRENIELRRRRYPEKLKARQCVQDAVKSGKLQKPSKCESCNREFPKKKLQGHHADYSKPLDVKWLCTDCHFTEHHGDRFYKVDSK